MAPRVEARCLPRGMRIALKQGQLRGIYKSDKLNPMVDMPLPRYESMMAVANGQHPEEFRGGGVFWLSRLGATMAL